MSEGPIIATVKVRFWLLLYLDAVLLFCHLTGRKPDLEKVDRMIRRGIKVS
jgi:hypothetical protein